MYILAFAVILTIFVKKSNAVSTVVDTDKPQFGTENIEASATVRAVEDEGALSHSLRAEVPSTLPTPSINPNAPDVADNPLNPSNDGVPDSHLTGGVKATLDHDSTHAFVKDIHETPVAAENTHPSAEIDAEAFKAKFALLVDKLDESEANKEKLIPSFNKRWSAQLLAKPETKGEIATMFLHTLLKLHYDEDAVRELLNDDANLNRWFSHVLKH
ncbi:RxLR-like protein [Plasmopara halstedii]|uniref:RxLR-like protein n=1 Tax=Plasmopara halstedii TaxID=4781 RepID=A0A0P1AUM8_PLAHL|nr:RxLR-like protein [Plasmopara halstedii]CEG45981.1 RxLR-like protein [Plasmopara halstedii]|eukprot:XP_024582350.1 RxLR-like protein [Plasmopara halstedii]